MTTEQPQQGLDDGTGRVHPPLARLIDTVVAMLRPENGLGWLRSQQVRAPGTLAVAGDAQPRGVAGAAECLLGQLIRSLTDTAPTPFSD